MRHIILGLGVAAGALAGCSREIPRHEEQEVSVTALTSPAAGPESADPGLAVDPATGELLLSWVGGDSTAWALYFARSSDWGESWSDPVTVAGGDHEVHPHGESSPRLVAGPGGQLAITWAKSIQVPGRRWPATVIRTTRSGNGGATWSAPQTLNDDTTGAPVSHQFHGSAWLGDSGLVVSWLDERKGAALEIHHGTSPTAGDQTDEPDAVIFSAFSPDFGRTWADSNSLMWGQVCPCCRVNLARRPDGRVTAAWRKHYPGNIRDVVTVEVEQGRVAEPVRVNQDNWVYPGCPHTGPAIAVGPNGASHVAWYMGKEGSAGVYYQRVSGNGPGDTPPVALVQARTLPAAHPSVASLPSGHAVAAWDMTETGDRAISVALLGPDRAILNRLTLAGSEGGQYPQVLAGAAGSAVVAYIGKDGNQRQVRIVRVSFPGTGTAETVAVKE